MKNKIFMMIIVVMAISLFACTSERTKSDEIFRFINFAPIDSCQYGMINDHIMYYYGDTTILLNKFNNAISVITKTDTTEFEGMLAYTETLASRWPKPELYSSVCLRKFTKLIKNGIIDSCFTNKMESSIRYDFYLKDYKISIHVKDAVAFKSSEEIDILVKDIAGTTVYEYTYQAWSIQEKQSILNVLLSRWENQKSVTSKKTPAFVWTKEYEESLKKEISDGVMKEFNK